MTVDPEIVQTFVVLDETTIAKPEDEVGETVKVPLPKTLSVGLVKVIV